MPFNLPSVQDSHLVTSPSFYASHPFGMPVTPPSSTSLSVLYLSLSAKVSWTLGCWDFFACMFLIINKYIYIYIYIFIYMLSPTADVPLNFSSPAPARCSVHLDNWPIERKEIGAANKMKGWLPKLDQTIEWQLHIHLKARTRAAGKC